MFRSSMVRRLYVGTQMDKSGVELVMRIFPNRRDVERKSPAPVTRLTWLAFAKLFSDQMLGKGGSRSSLVQDQKHILTATIAGV